MTEKRPPSIFNVMPFLMSDVEMAAMGLNYLSCNLRLSV